MFSQHASHTPTRTQRSSVQIPAPGVLDVVCQVLGSERRIVFEGSIQNLSRSGASLVAARLPARDATLVLIIQRPCAGPPYRRTAKLIHARPHRQREWLIACEFTEMLSEEEVHDLLSVCPW